ncbi:hypothetical protein HYW21_00730 [Candidatus Woesearchaeota archaeon]|nr:hypothetical protein [Candidatus Woesearchaeota archaeon]
MTPEEVILRFYQSHLNIGTLPLEQVRDPNAISNADYVVIRAPMGGIFEAIIPFTVSERDGGVLVRQGWYARGEYQEAPTNRTGSIRYFVQGRFPNEIHRSPLPITDRQCRQGLVYKITEQQSFPTSPL